MLDCKTVCFFSKAWPGGSQQEHFLWLVEGCSQYSLSAVADGGWTRRTYFTAEALSLKGLVYALADAVLFEQARERLLIKKLTSDQLAPDFF